MIDVAVIVGKDKSNLPVVGIFCGKEEINNGIKEFKKNSEIKDVKYCFGGKMDTMFMTCFSPVQYMDLKEGYKIFKVSLRLNDTLEDKIIKWIPDESITNIIASNIHLVRITDYWDENYDWITIVVNACSVDEAVRMAKVHRDYIVGEKDTKETPSMDYTREFLIEGGDVLL